MRYSGNHTLRDVGENNSANDYYPASSIPESDREELAGFAESLGMFFCEYRDILESLGMKGSDNRFSVSDAHLALEDVSGRDSLNIGYVDRVLAASTMYDPCLTGAYLSSGSKKDHGPQDTGSFQKEYQFEI